MVVGCAQVVDEVETVSLAGTSWILAATWQCSLARAGIGVEELISRAVEEGVESASATEVLGTEVVSEVETVGSSGTCRVLAATWYSCLTL